MRRSSEPFVAGGLAAQSILGLVQLGQQRLDGAVAAAAGEGVHGALQALGMGAQAAGLVLPPPRRALCRLELAAQVRELALRAGGLGAGGAALDLHGFVS